MKEISFKEFPFENINNLTEGKGLMIFNGNPAQKYSGRYSWLELLEGWNRPLVILNLTRALPSGDTPGSVFSYYALCKELSIPVLGVL